MLIKKEIGRKIQVGGGRTRESLVQQRTGHCAEIDPYYGGAGSRFRLDCLFLINECED